MADKPTIGTLEVIGHLNTLGEKIDGMNQVFDLRLKAIDVHLNTLNGKVAAHEKRIGQQELDHSYHKGREDVKDSIDSLKSKIVIGIAVMVAGTMWNAISALL